MAPTGNGGGAELAPLLVRPVVVEAFASVGIWPMGATTAGFEPGEINGGGGGGVPLPMGATGGARFGAMISGGIGGGLGGVPIGAGELPVVWPGDGAIGPMGELPRQGGEPIGDGPAGTTSGAGTDGAGSRRGGDGGRLPVGGFGCAGSGVGAGGVGAKPLGGAGCG